MIKERQVEEMMNVMRNKKGFTLVEVMIALVVVLLVFLALMQTALVGIDSNMINILRDEAVSIAEMRMNEARNQPFDSLVTTPPETVSRNFRNITNFSYTVTRTVTDLNADNKQVNITVTWEWKGNPYTHSITSILRRQ
jgi:type IV pilus assembly protein PilV